MTTTIDLFRNAEETETHPAGDVIFREGDPGHAMYAVQDGEVDLVVHGNVVETVGAGGIFGEMSLLLDGHRRSATAVARTPCRLAPVTERRFNFLVQQTPHFALQVMRIIAGRLVRMDARL
ncbi:MAG TPA: cyclic nucleotide-binding domain-containing protein [Thermoanaerobaculia bacterium]|nr:cyclic nucleotide-binding domain-containing protein [Thermoanaerobaculia bacterium]